MFRSRTLKKLIFMVLSAILIISFYEFLRRGVGSFAGSYPFAETWRIEHSIENVERKLVQLHNMKPNLFKDKSTLSLENDHTGYWKIVYFYYSDREEVVKVLIREGEGGTNISLLSFINKKDGKVRLMNKDFSFFHNQREKRIFESRILKYL